MSDNANMPGWPLLLRRELAASYLGMSPSMFDIAVKDGLLPKPLPTVGRVRAWHRRDLDSWAEDRRNATDLASNPWDDAA